MFLYIPVTAVGVSSGGLAHQDHRAVLLVLPEHTGPKRLSLAVLVTATLLELLLFVLGLVLLLPLAPPWALLALPLVIVGAIILDTAAIGLRLYRRRSPGGGLKRRRQQLQADGAHVLELAQFAAHPRGQHYGDQLVRQLLPHVPPTTTLLVMAINETMADRYVVKYGFSRPDPKKQPLLLQR